MATKRQTETTKALRRLVPMIPFNEAEEVKQLAGQRHLRSLPASVAVWLSLVAHVRHVHTDYDRLLDEGYDRDSARHFVLDDINAVLQRWQATRLLDESETDGKLPDPVEDQTG
ncbi:DUF2293 domain-containing protein [Oricola thermophila]|uniref:DUF2293 domain-containing protein n=1 Tax=Oricola thermophila TaxID=2742145 RepID=A0A6N1VCX5_9HYPH|nr:DUF2293 domain-containing protein [Oricola thermophila]QKV18383.1 DUF2293 domain-containing protein [Oricola thermophila]